MRKVLGIIIPTKNHSDFVIRQLNYYSSSLDFPFTIYLGDSSDGIHRDRILARVDELKGQLKVVYHWVDPTVVAHAVPKQLVDIVEEKYVAFLGDDDLFVPEGLKDCIEFLESNPHYSAAQGQAVLFELDREGAYGEIEILGRYFIKECELETPAERLNAFLADYWVLDFSVHRTDAYRATCDCRDMESSRFLVDGSFAEILTGCLDLIRGKAKKLDRLYLFRQAGSHRYGLSKNNLLDWISHPNWQSSFERFHDTVTEALVRHADLCEESASELLRVSFSKYLANSMGLRPDPTGLWRKINGLRRTLERSPAVKHLYNRARMINPGFRRDLRLERLLSRTSPYHDDFMPAYRVITSKDLQ